MLPLIDSLTHPTVSGKWLTRCLDARFETLVTSLRTNGFSGACAVGLANVGDYDHTPFLELCKKYPVLFPVAGFQPNADIAAKSELARLRDLGFRAIKIHPRFSRLTDRLADLVDVFRAAGTLNMTVFYCTYLHGPIEHYPVQDPFISLVQLLRSAPSARVILVHGGDVQLMRYAELVRFNDNLLLDLSLTMLKYEGSSVDDDIRFLFRQFDRRICVGSDHPEYSHDQLRRRFEKFAAGLSSEKQENIGFRNLSNFLEWTPKVV